MDCDQARNLFDAFLDGELSPSLATELASHRLTCEDCRRALALMEVVEQVVKCDEDIEPIGLCEGFTDRLLACIEQPEAKRAPLLSHRWLAFGVPLAAAALLAFLLMIPGRGPETHHVLGKTEVGEPVPNATDKPSAPPLDPDNVQDAWQHWLQDLQDQWDADRTGGQHLRRALESTAEQWLNVDSGDNGEGASATDPAPSQEPESTTPADPNAPADR